MNKYFLLLFLFVAGLKTGYGQNRGLLFYGNEVRYDQRTSMSLSANRPINFKKELRLSFSVNFREANNNSYGYIWKFISDMDDVLGMAYKYISANQELLVFTFNNNYLPLDISLSEDYLNDGWYRVEVWINRANNRLSVSLNDSIRKETDLIWHQRKGTSIVFGANNNNPGSGYDVAPMTVADIKLVKDKKKEFFWKMDEKEGEIAIEHTGKMNASVLNPGWLSQYTGKWKLSSSVDFKDPIPAAVDAGSNRIFIINKESLSILNYKDSIIKTYTYKNEFPEINIKDCRAEYDSKGGSIIIFDLSHMVQYSLDERTMIWDKYNIINNDIDPLSEYTCIFNKRDRLIYVIGGEQNGKLSNGTYLYDIEEMILKDLSLKGSKLLPAKNYTACTTSSEEKVFLFGGYGVESGDPLFARCLNSLYLFDFNTMTIELIGVFEDNIFSCTSQQPFVYDSEEKIIYGVRYPVTGATGSSYSEMGIVGRDTLSAGYLEPPGMLTGSYEYLKIWFDQSSNKFFLLVNIHTDEGNNRLDIYHMDGYLPVMSGKKEEKPRSNLLYWYLVMVLFDILLIFIYFLRNRNIKRYTTNKRSETAPSEIKFFSKPLDGLWRENATEDLRANAKCSIFLFGGFHIYFDYDREATGMFSPLIKELFIYLLINSVNNERGISTKNIVDQLWFDMSPKRARNNLAVNIGKLRSLFNKDAGDLIVNEGGFWRIDLSAREELLYCDYCEVMKIFEKDNDIQREDVVRLISIIQQGRFLFNINYEWADKYISEISDLVIDGLIDFVENNERYLEAGLVIKIADSIMKFDMVNENAVRMKCRAQVSMGKHSIAKLSYQKFIEEYKVLYDETYPYSFKQIIE